MHLFYQKHDGVTDFLLSSDGRTNWLNWKRKYDKADAEFIIHTFKQVPVQFRIMDDSTKLWSIIGPAGHILIAHFESFITQKLLKHTELHEITDDLSARLAAGNLSKPLRKQKEEIKFNEEEFFYAPSGASESLSPEVVLSELSKMLGTDEEVLSNASEKELKSFYRSAALKFHPDRNNGDGSKMSELNMYWQIFNQGVKA